MQRQMIPNWSNDVGDRFDIEVLTGEVLNGLEVRQNMAGTLLSVQEVINAFGSFPPYSVVFGVCEDGLPLVLNLRDPAAGSILIEGDPRNGKTQVLRTVLTSAAYLNDADSVNFCIISPYPDEMAGLYKFPHCQGLTAPYERQASEIVLELSAIAEQRRYGRESGPAFLLVIDDLGALIGEHLDYEVLLNLRWLIAKGPGSQIWTVATIPNHSAAAIDSEICTFFGTKMLNGRSMEISNSNEQTNLPSLFFEKDRGNVFSTWIQKEFIQFIPLSTR